MQAQRIDNMFNGLTFEKSATEIIDAAVKKAASIRAKIEERGIRIHKMRTEHKVTDAVLLDIQNQMRAQAKQGLERISYTSNTKSNTGGPDEEVTIGAGVINFLLTEQDFIDGEKSQCERLDTIARNLKDVYKYAPDGKGYTAKPTLSYEELKYLGF